jgi:mannosyltransferase OCH1-like enzyme
MLLESEFPRLRPLYKNLPKIQQADLLRLLFVYVHGGLYIDIYVRCARLLEETLERTGFDPSMDSLVAFVEGSALSFPLTLSFSPLHIIP